jgi:exodeoxyribonuclease VII large subunit
VSWDLFSSAAAARGEPLNETRNEESRAASPRARRSCAPGPAAPRPRRAGGRSGRSPTVNAAARDLIEGVFPPMWVSGEVSNFVRARSGHCYFTLRDGDAQLRVRDVARRRAPAPHRSPEGMEVRALGRLTLYAARGEFQLTVAELEAKGEGLWKLALDRLRVKLESGGAHSPARSAAPAHPACVGVVTSPSGAALHDIVTVIRRRAPWTRIVLAGCAGAGRGRRRRGRGGDAAARARRGAPTC